MTTTVRVFCVQGLATLPVVSGSGLAYDSVQALKWPPLGRDLLSCDTSTTDISDAAAAPANTQLAYVQVQTGKSVHFEIIPGGFTETPASTTSPIMSGNQTVAFGPGWRISVLEAV